MKGPRCSICEHEHWYRDPHVLGKKQITLPAPANRSTTDTRRGGRRVLKAEAARPDATRTASTERPDPPTPPASASKAKAGKPTQAEKVRTGNPKTAQKARKKK